MPDCGLALLAPFLENEVGTTPMSTQGYAEGIRPIYQIA
jgi:hypothetical protein